jgi:hypothetical protein
MAQFIMKGARPLVVWHQDALQTFSPGTIVEANEAPHEWFELVEAPKEEKKPTPPPVVKPVVKKKAPTIAKEKSKPKVDLPSDKF